MMQTIEISLADETSTKQQLINNIENIIVTILEQMHNGNKPNVTYTILQESTNEIDEFFENAEATYIDANNKEKSVSLKNRVIKFANKTGRIQLIRIMTVLSRSYSLLKKDQSQTKRSLYYELKSEEVGKYFTNENILDNSIYIARLLLSSSTWDLGIIATAKGLVAGDLILKFEDGTVKECTTSGDTLIPPIRSLNNGRLCELKTSAKAILIVEKESIFHRLLTEKCPEKLSVILITGKGYPDKATKYFIKLLVDNLKIPIYILVDANPHGFEIMCSYKYGSRRSMYEAVAVNKIKWIGIYPSELTSCFGAVSRTPLTANDIEKLSSLERRNYLTDFERIELEAMRVGKIDIEAIAAICPSMLTLTYIPTNIKFGLSNK